MTYIGSLQGSTGASQGGSLSSLLGSGSGISGLASGINTDSIVQGLVQAAQVPLVSLLQQRQLNQWKEEQYQQINNSISDLQNSVSNLKLQSTFMQQTASSSNSTLVTGSASTMTPAGSYSVSVQQLAQGATISSSSVLSTSSTYGDTTLSSLLNGQTSTVNLTVNGQQFSFDPTKDTINTVLQAITSDSTDGVTGFYDANAGKVVLQTTATGSGAKIQVSNDPSNIFSSVFKLNTASSLTTSAIPTGGMTTNGVVEINGYKFNFQGSSSSPLTASSIVSQINNETTTTGVSATLNSTTNQITLSGSNLYSPVSISDQQNYLGLQGQTAANAAKDAQYTVNGFASTSSTNAANYNGLSLNFLGTTSSPVNVTVTTNTDAVVKSITDFVKQYNTTLQLMQGYYNQKRNYDYQPLTAQQASQMTQTQIDKWNQKAQSGMLQNDTLLRTTMNDMESAMSAQVTGQTSSVINGTSTTLNSLSSIGITPIDPMSGVSSGSTAPGVSTTGWNTYGLLQVNTDKLKQAIQADPQAAMRMFTNDPTIPGEDSTMGQGIAVQLYNGLVSSSSSITQEAGTNTSMTPPSISDMNKTSSNLPYNLIDPNADFNTLFGSDSIDVSSLGKSISELDSQATSMQQNIDSLRQRYQSEFAQMEQAVSQFSTQSSYLAGMMGGGSGTSSSTGG